ncbi:MAG TPA: Rho termination factor N-terminal domain-containing protein [Solirubrobacteraceae bacterium]|jgi:transcription termination factor Rho|nr:Rho termination factor N-terminal domain-containing protein [Solirubrobacteraceae bacterium]
MSVLDRSGLEESPLADLHAIASELAIDGYRRLRRADLIDSILAHQSGEEVTEGRSAAADADADADAAADPGASDDASRDEAKDDQPASRRRRGRRGGRGRAGAREDAESTADEGDEARVEPNGGRGAAQPARGAAQPARGAAQPARGANRSARAEEAPAPAEAPAEAAVVEGVVELLPNGSGFLRVSPPDSSDDDVYISAAQVKRCELLSGDVIAGPPRPPRRSERFPSLVRVDLINGRPAGEAVEGSRFDDLPVAFPGERIPLGSEDPTLKAIEWLTPFGKGSRVTIVGASRSGKTEALRRLAAPLAERSDLQVSLVLAGVRPEEVSDWRDGPLQPVAAVSFAVSPDVQAHVVEPVLDAARRLAARGSDVVLLIDTLDGLPPLAARKALAAARNIVDGGSLTVIATASAPVGGETTVITLDVALASTGRFPAIDLRASGTIRPERLVGDAAAEAIARARIEAAEDS